MEAGRTCRQSEKPLHKICGRVAPGDLSAFSLSGLRAENHCIFPHTPSFQALHKSTIVHIVSSQMDSGCPGDEAEVDILAIEKDRGGKELDGYLRRLPYQTVCRPVEKRFHVCTMEILSWPSSPALCISQHS